MIAISNDGTLCMTKIYDYTIAAYLSYELRTAGGKISIICIKDELAIGCILNFE